MKKKSSELTAPESKNNTKDNIMINEEDMRFDKKDE